MMDIRTGRVMMAGMAGTDVDLAAGFVLAPISA